MQRNLSPSYPPMIRACVAGNQCVTGLSSLPFLLVLEWFQVVFVVAGVGNILSHSLYAAQKHVRYSLTCDVWNI